MNEYEITIRYISGGYSNFTMTEKGKICLIDILKDNDINLIELNKNENGIDLYIFKNNICCVEVIDNENNMYK
ncbi:TPA: hypothetical protein PTV97_003761 [Clostridium botulinum]|nr:hypothetical protein [Clostridium botulinum]